MLECMSTSAFSVDVALRGIQPFLVHGRGGKTLCRTHLRRVIASVFLAVLFGLRVVWLDYRLRPIGPSVFGSEILLVCEHDPRHAEIFRS